MIVINQGQVNYRYKVSEEGPIIYDTVLSNRVVTSIIDFYLKVNKEVDKLMANIYDVITYTVSIQNISNEIVYNIVLKDETPKGTNFIKDSLKVNGVTQYNLTPENLYIGNLQPSQNVIISFKVSVASNCHKCKDNIINYGIVCYDFIYNIEKDPIKICLLTNKVNTYIMYNIFTQTSVSASLTINLRACEKIKICKIDSCGKVLKCKVIKTITGTKILVIWEITYFLYYLRYFTNYQYEVCSDIYKEYFSTLLDVPCGIEECNEKCFKILNENCSYHYLLGENRLIIYNSILIIANNF
ncbi:DUF11 domain-containing protein [Clostridium butyricum]|uniref:Cell surface protein n=1 Tax=Clostridium butyricum E4 str. BoNT E BL5262 TaxID=632245 RepID=C4IG23_CLOBU|nr:DUF11 domain-containing protein [Clostridium butyricum]EDT77012.1 cell surface protein [Clostridium butyricum 5521]EEP54721.1 cell surface protein [Clostridium butyricum E4 str. BoNT E BL5262]NFL31762.1 DUF11 domain-containing protein [Clostridium butyricum]NFS18609.1 DUF11 domain-containing protein [Clostridium butyricum]